MTRTPPVLVNRVPVAAFVVTSAVFHYLGPALAVLLFTALPETGVAWLRIAGAALVFGIWRRPWRIRPTARGLWILLGLGAVLAAMNVTFYLAIARLPLSTVGAVEFLGVLGLAAAGLRTRRNAAAFACAAAGVAVLADIRVAGEPLGFVLALANCVLFVLYVTLGHRAANQPGADGIDTLAASMLVAALVATPFGIAAATPAFTRPDLLLTGFAVAVCSSVIPYVTDQLVMARVRRATFALLLCLLPASATVIGAVVLAQAPTPQDLAGVALVIAGIALHRQHEDEPRRHAPSEAHPRP
ncbi:EamA family transporter [Phytomonospora endophytica]|uniref:Inner membrane transporter RhtA n=1 Tax=Phytomonospora endophytica TaxID=714109 RepID=A0A841FW45_9ACTN|nr:EamA family transporter [Phytomonospora endophytica]MBB6037958.1 inner membrane transporter RhtA [Phytomonospora endophytica]GIG68858.1 membrane protein [Phytomonospora endophytica]